MLEAGIVPKAKVPQTLSIFTAHNYKRLSLFERSLRTIGVNDYDVVNVPLDVWSNSKRVRWFVEYLENGCDTPVVLYCDADDTVLRTNPLDVLRIFVEHECKLLYGSTAYRKGYKCMQRKRRWAERVHGRRYLNAGVFIGFRTFIVDVYSRVLEYVDESKTESAELAREFYSNELAWSDGFPYGVGCDQVILRFLEREFYPSMRVDIGRRMAFRN